MPSTPAYALCTLEQMNSARSIFMASLSSPDDWRHRPARSRTDRLSSKTPLLSKYTKTPCRRSVVIREEADERVKMLFLTQQARDGGFYKQLGLGGVPGLGAKMIRRKAPRLNLKLGMDQTLPWPRPSANLECSLR